MYDEPIGVKRFRRIRRMDFIGNGYNLACHGRSAWTKNIRNANGVTLRMVSPIYIIMWNTT